MHPAANQYRKHQMSTSTPAQLIGLLYDGLLASIRRGAEALHEGTNSLANEQLVRAQRIVTELRCSLNFEAGGEIATNLDAIYDYVWRQLVACNTRRDPAMALQCLELVVPLRDAWAEALLGQGVPERIPA